MVIRVTGTSRHPEAQRETNAAPTPFRLFEGLFNDWARNAYTQRREGCRPAVDIFEKDTNFIIRAELPGVAEKDLDIRLDGRTLTIKAEKKLEPEEAGYTYHQVEGFYGSCSRSFDLPDTVDAEKISASFKNGVLQVSMPQKPETQPRSIKVSLG